MIDLIVGAVIVAILALAIGYIVRAKKAGVRCIGCSAGGSCATAPSVDSGEDGCSCGGGCSGCGGDCGYGQ